MSKVYLAIVSANLPAHLDKSLVQKTLLHTLQDYVTKMKPEELPLLEAEAGCHIITVNPE